MAETRVSKYIAKHIASCGKPYAQIKQEAGFPEKCKPNIISMIKTGTTNMPLSRIAGMAKAIDASPLEVYLLCMEEYEPETWKVIQEQILKHPVITMEEFKAIEKMRAAQ